MATQTEDLYYEQLKDAWQEIGALKYTSKTLAEALLEAHAEIINNRYKRTPKEYRPDSCSCRTCTIAREVMARP